MRLVNRTDIEDWSKSFDSKGNFPILIARLVKATTPYSTISTFPSGSAAFVGGFDGYTECKETTQYVPEGVGLWEFGTEKSTPKKIEADYQKRKKDTLGYDPSKSTLILVTPRFWRFKERWRLEKLTDGFWKDIRVYDSRDLEEWLDQATVVGRWFSTYLRKFPSDGILTTEVFWQEFAFGPRGEMSPLMVTAGRETESQSLMTFLSGQPNIKGIKAASKDEAIAFIIASAKNFEASHQDIFFSRSIIVSTQDSFRNVRINNRYLNLIAKFDELQILFAAVADGHHVLVPLGPDDTFNQETITLPKLSRDGQVNALKLLGLNEDKAIAYSRDAGRDLTVLKRLLKYPQSKVEWLKRTDVRSIVPAMLLGRWNDNKPGDQQLLQILSGQTFIEYAKILNGWKDIIETPILQIGDTWRLVSPLDMWNNLSPFLVQDDFVLLRSAFDTAFKNGNPEMPAEEGAITFPGFTRGKTFSSWSREGLLQSLILIGLYGNGLQIKGLTEPQLWVDDLIADLLNGATADLWISLDHELPLLAEASPKSFLSAVAEGLSMTESPILAMFKETPGFLSSTTNYTGLLWALEGLAWTPEYLNDVGLILAHLSMEDPGGSIVNRPINSLTEIFKTWHFQTLANLDQRKEAIRNIVSEFPEIAWKLLVNLLPDDHGVAHPTNKMRWRNFGTGEDIEYFWEEIYETHSFAVEQLLDLYNGSSERLVTLIKESVNLTNPDRIKIVELAKKANKEQILDKSELWKTVRSILYKHRSHPKTDWALPEPSLVGYVELYQLFEPLDLVGKYKWLFDEHWPNFSDGMDYGDDNSPSDHYKVQEEKIDKARQFGLDEIIKNYGIEKVIELSAVVKEPGILGNVLARTYTDEEKYVLIAESLNHDSQQLWFGQRFFFIKSIENGQSWTFEFFSKLVSAGFSDRALTNYLVAVEQTPKLWEFIDQKFSHLRGLFWKNANPNLFRLNLDDKLIGIRYLLEHKRFFAVLDMAAHWIENLPTQLILEILERSMREKSADDGHFKGYELGLLFKALENREDVSEEAIVKLEWLYLPVLDRYRTGLQPKHLQRELLNDPTFFIEVVKWAYKPESDQLLEEETANISNEQLVNRSVLALKLLNDLETVPGLNKDGSFNGEHLTTWVKNVRALAKNSERLNVTDSQIGRLLAQYPEKKEPNWPPRAIAEIVEKSKSDRIRRGFSSALFNKRGSSTRGAFAGGDIERGHATYFEDLARKNRSKFPALAQIFSRLAKNYVEDARLRDLEAERDKLDY